MSINPVTASHALYQIEESINNNNDPALDLALKIRVVSKFDPNIEISRSVWAVTMVTEKGHFHVRLVFEGVREKTGAFFRIAHLQGPKTWTAPQEIFNCFLGWSKTGRVDSGKRIEHEKLRLDGYGRKTETWARPSEKIEQIIENIKAEEAGQDKDQVIPFSFFGRRSILTKEMEFFETDHPDLKVLQQTNPSRLAYLFDLSKKQELVEQLTNRSEQNILTVLDNPTGAERGTSNNVDLMTNIAGIYASGLFLIPPIYSVPIFLGLVGTTAVVAKTYTKTKIYFSTGLLRWRKHC